jgi:hypothetical protein
MQMKLYSQYGWGDGEKTQTGLSENIIQGVICSPKDIAPDAARTKVENLVGVYPDSDFIMDPQFYVNLHATAHNVKLGKLPDWEFFRGYRQSQLEDLDKIDEVLQAYYDVQIELPVTAIVAPNIHVTRSFDSLQCSIAKNFIRRTGKLFARTGEDRPVYASLVVSREALLEQKEFELFLNDITALDNPPDGFYLVVSASSSSTRNEIFHADVIANWMLLNYSLKTNGFHVINGYSDLLSPLLGAAGGDAGATGWWSNLRQFSMEKFLPEHSGGKQPVIRYLSTALWNRITWTEKRAFESIISGFANGLPHDADYSPEPKERASEVLQSWEALQYLLQEHVTDDVESSLASIDDALATVQLNYTTLAAQISFARNSGDEHLAALDEGLSLFKRRAQL